jgi:tubulin-folding cofactor B
MQGLVQNTTIKLSIEHNISSSKVLEARFDLNQTVLAVKENIEARYGSVVPYMKLQLKDSKNNLIADLQEDGLTLGHYGAQTGMVIYVIDSNPNSILKEIESFEGVEKYMMSDEDYDKLPDNFRKWKTNFLKQNPNIIHINKNAVTAQELDPDYLSELASTIQVGTRCKLESGARGEICYVGKVVDLGNGYFVGVRLDEPFGNSNGIVKGVKFFEANDKYATFVRPTNLEVGDFPVLDIDD